MNSMHPSAQNHSAGGYLQRLSTKELFHLLHCHWENSGGSSICTKEILSILESRFEEMQTKQQQAR